jgi:ABC-type multidrug transport system ATPase subunit
VPEVCNKCLIIDQGEKKFEGTPANLKRKIGKSLDEKFRKIIS